MGNSILPGPVVHHPPVIVPVAALAPRAILPDDPGVALRLATELLEDDRKMANHHRGLWGYVGTARDGHGPLTIQSTGVGAASARLVFEQLATEGLELAIRVGTARSATHQPGSVVAVAVASDAEGTFTLNPRLSDALTGVSDGMVTVTSTALPTPTDDVADLETAELARCASELSIEFGALLAISNALGHEGVAEATAQAGIRAGRVIGPSRSASSSSQAGSSSLPPA